MFTIPISDDEVYVLQDSLDDDWQVHRINYMKKAVKSFSVDGFGLVSRAYFSKDRNLIWVIADNTIYAIKCSDKEVFEAPMPKEEFYVYDILPTSSALYACGEYTHLWRCKLPELVWEPILTPKQKPTRSKDPAVRTRQNMEYARQYPPLYKAFMHHRVPHFCGALGTLVQLSGKEVKRADLSTGAKLVNGSSEGSWLALEADTPSAEIYFGSVEEGFELIFTDNLRALHLTTLHQGKRYVGVAAKPHSEVHNLYTWIDEELMPEQFGEIRPPSTLVTLKSTGKVLWVADEIGVFRYANNCWSLLEIEDLGSDSWFGET